MAEHFDIAVVGAGTAGAALAAALDGSGYRIALIDPGTPAIAPSGKIDGRVLALSAGAHELLQACRAWPALNHERVQPYAHMRVWDSENDAHIAFDAQAFGRAQLGWIVEETHLVAALHAVVAECTEVRPYWQRRIAHLAAHERPLRVRLDDGTRLTADLVVGADGAQSAVRERAGIDVTRHDYHASAIVCRVEVAGDHTDTAWQRFLPSGPLAFLPLADQAFSIVWSTREPDALLALDDAAFITRLSTAIGPPLDGIEHVGTRRAFPLARIQATRQLEGNIVLVGDSAHRIHPLAGQGANLGLADVASLSHELKQAAEHKRPASHPAALARFERSRSAPNLGMALSMDAFDQFFATDSPALSALRGAALDTANRAVFLKRLFAETAAG
ncbi:MAG: FAD-dependent monooxygenase [Chromatiales bacterium]|nr:FAD-dependent monooxygenase [Chromatiales bacterium]